MRKTFLMNENVFKLLFLAMIVSGLCSSSCIFETNGDKDAYLAQNPPGSLPELFAPDILKPLSGKKGVHSSPSFSSDGREMYFTVMPEEGPFLIKSLKIENGSWTLPKTVDFKLETESFNSIFYNNDNSIVFKSLATREDIQVNTLWKIERENGEWGQPVELSRFFDGVGMGYSVSSSGTVYLTGYSKGKFKLYKSELIQGEYTKPVPLQESINNGINDNWQPCIAPDESYLIFGRYVGEPKVGQCSLFISFRKNNGEWSEPLDLGKEINASNAMWPYVSPNGKYFFFVSDKNSKENKDAMVWQIYWMDADFIDKFRQQISLD